MNLLDLMVKIGVDDQASNKIADIGGNIGSKLASAAKVGTAAVAAVGAAATAAAAGLASAADSVASYGDNVDKMSQKMGLSATAYQEWDAVMRHSGTSMETMKAGMKTLANAVESGNEAFQRIGLTQEQLKNMSQEEIFAATIEGLQKVDNETERTYLAGQLLGRGATELGALLNTSAEDTQAMKDRVHELGGVMSDEAVKASANFKDKLQDMTTAFSALKRNLVSEFLPGLSLAMDGLADIFSGNSGAGAAKVEEGIQQVVEKIRSSIPRIIEVVGQVAPPLLEVAVSVVTAIAEQIPALVTQLLPVFIEQVPVIVESATQMFLGIVQALTDTGPGLIDQIINTVYTVADTLIEHAPEILEASFVLFTAIAEALLNKAPDIIDKLVQLLMKLIDSVVQNAPKMLEAAGKFVVTMLQQLAEKAPQILQSLLSLLAYLVQSVISAVPQMLAAAGQLIMALLSQVANGLAPAMQKMNEIGQGMLSAIGGFVGQMFSAGANLVWGIIDGISRNIGYVLDVITGGLQDAVNGALEFLGIASPSKLFAWMGEMTMQGMAEGIEDTAAEAEKAMRGAARGIYGAASGTVEVDGAFQAAGAAAAPRIVIEINDPVVKEEADVDRILDYVETQVQRKAGMLAWNPSLSTA